MRKLFWLPVIALVSLILMPVQAIDEVTPTPMPPAVVTSQPPLTTVNVTQFLEDALTNLENSNFQAAVDLTTGVIASEADNAEAYVLRGLANGRMNRLSLAVEDMTYAIELVPETYHPNRAVAFPINEWLVYTLRGDLNTQLGDTAAALADYDMALSLAPHSENMLALVNRADLNRQLGDTAAAEVDELLAQAMEAMNQRNLNQALDLLTEAIDSGLQTPIVAIAYYNRALLQLAQEDAAAALEDYTAALELNPQMHLAYLARGTVFRQQGDIAAAGADYYNRITTLGSETVERTAVIGDSFDIEMDYRRVVRITFEGSSGHVVTIRADEAEAETTDPLIALLDPNGEPIAGDDDSGGNLDSEIADFALPVGGVYTLLVSHAEGAYFEGFEGIIRVSIASAGI